MDLKQIERQLEEEKNVRFTFQLATYEIQKVQNRFQLMECLGSNKVARSGEEDVFALFINNTKIMGLSLYTIITACSSEIEWKHS
ncbi:hypothetical protein [Kurthia senegalensis]|uniref:hypothetical protein n=1 Tax=Kurthia senegalensis TaxID=1033740 RepID=UPI0002883D47|nr:hypothetical protein [Kurthia senegalensis]